MPACEMKGLSLLNYPLVLAELRGRDVCDQVLARIPPELRHKLGSGEILANGWYPVAWKCALHDAGHEITRDPSLARAMGYEMTKRDLHGIYALLMRATSLRHVLSISARLLGRYLRPVQMHVLDKQPDAVRVAFTGGEGFSQELWQDIAGGCLATLELAGARRAWIRIEDGGQTGDTHAEGVARWRSESDAPE